MAWTAENRTLPLAPSTDGPFVTESMKAYLRDTYFPRYPTKRAVLLPALHLIQHTYNWIPMQALQEVADFLEIAPSEALDTATFYEEYWLKPRGKYLIQVCRSIACELCESNKLTEHLQRKLNVDTGETTSDGKYTLIELECLGACGSAPVTMVNEVLFENVKPEDLDSILASLPDNPADLNDPKMPPEMVGHGEHH